MALSAQILGLIRDEIGNDLDFSDAIPHDPDEGQLDSLENIYTDTERGNFNVLRTALICWRRRLGNLQARSFDVTTEGTLLNRSQRIRFLERQIKKYEVLVDDTYKGRNQEVQTPVSVDDAILGINSAEFSSP